MIGGHPDHVKLKLRCQFCCSLVSAVKRETERPRRGKGSVAAAAAFAVVVKTKYRVNVH